MNDMLMNGVELMLVGMGIVFLFLAMLVVAVNTMSSIVSRFIPETATLKASATQSTENNKIDSNVVAAISAAIYKYRAQHKK